MSNQVQEMISVLSDRKLQKQTINSDRDYSGGGWFDEKTKTIILCSDTSFAYIIQSFVSVTGGGMSLPSQSKNEYFGTWSVIEENGILYLILKYEDGSQEKLQTRNLGFGSQEINYEAWGRYLIQ
jgi:hypothetical protein